MNETGLRAPPQLRIVSDASLWGSGALRSNCYSDRNLQIADSLSGVNNGIYSCRAECDIDIANFLAAATESRTEMEVRHRAVDPDDAFMSEMVLEFESPASIDSLREIMRGCVDLHVMRQSLRPCPLSENSLERDDDIE